MSWGEAILKAAQKNPHCTVVDPKKPATEASKRLRREAIEARENWIFEQLDAAGYPEPERQYKFDPNRNYRADFAWPEWKIILEYQGGGAKGAHQRSVGYTNDRERSAKAQTLGFIVIEVTTLMIKNGDLQPVFDMLDAALKYRGIKKEQPTFYQEQ